MTRKEKQAVERAYGLLWRYMPSEAAPMVNDARKELLALIDADGKKRGATFAREKYGPPSEAEILKTHDGFSA